MIFNTGFTLLGFLNSSAEKCSFAVSSQSASKLTRHGFVKQVFNHGF